MHFEQHRQAASLTRQVRRDMVAKLLRLWSGTFRYEIWLLVFTAKLLETERQLVAG
jgi:hypothetical protein